MRNLAFHRAGLRSEVQLQLFDPSHRCGAFWREVHANFLDVSVLEWCKLFAERKGKHHWRRVIDNPDGFEGDLYTRLGVNAAEFAELISKMRRYRNTFVAHLDDERIMHPPSFDVAKASVAFLHERLAQRATTHEDWRSLPTTAEQLELGYEQASQEAQNVYDEALGHRRTTI